MQKNNRMVLIMAGGSGTRLWPLSRNDRPKQVIPLVGGQSLFQHAIERLRPDIPAEQILIVARGDLIPLLREEAPQIPIENWIIEPEGRGTAPAIGLGALHIARRDPDSLMAVLTADHFMADTAGFRRAMRAALELAEGGSLVTMGIRPSWPSTGYGYIEQGARLGEVQGLPAYQVVRFTEKPNAEVAQRMVQSGKYSWNSGMFFWRTRRILEEFARQMPQFSGQLERIRQAIASRDYEQVLGSVWPEVKKETIDYGIMEGAENVAVIPVEIGWSDVGSWASLIDLLPADEQGNILIGPSLTLDTRDTMIFGGKRVIATIGVSGLVIVDTDDALLICPKDREQEVRAVVEKLKESGREQYL